MTTDNPSKNSVSETDNSTIGIAQSTGNSKSTGTVQTSTSTGKPFSPKNLPTGKVPRPPIGFFVCCGLVALLLIGAVVSLWDDREFYSDVIVEISVFVVFVAGFFTNSRKLQLWYLICANLYNIAFLAVFGKVFFDNYSQGVGVLVLIQIIFSTINLVPIVMYHLSHRTFFYSYQRQLIYPTMFFAFVLLGHLPGGDMLTKEVTHEIFSLIIFAQAFDLMDSIHKIGKVHHMAAYTFAKEDGEVVDDEDDE